MRPSPDPHEPDIPLPVGFGLVDKSSEDWSNASVRYVRHRYRGDGDIHGLRRFYRNQMPLVRWTAVSDGFVGGRCTMRFERKGESCTIVIEEESSGWTRGLVVEVMITPAK